MKSRQDAWTEEDDLLLAETVLRHVREGSTQLNAFEEVGDKLNRTSAACGFRWNAVVRHQYEKALSLAKKQRKQRQRLLGKDQGGKKKLLYQPPAPSYDEIDAMSLSMSSEMSDENEEYTSPVMEAMEMMEKSEADTEFAEEPLESKDAGKPAVSETPMQTPMQTPTQAPAAQRMPVGGKVEMSLEKVIAYLQSLAQSNFHSDILKSENQRLKHENAEIRRQNAELEKKIGQLEKNTVTMQEDYETLMQIMNRARKLVLFEDEEGKAPRFKMDRNGNLEKVAE